MEWALCESMSQKTINNWLSLAEYDLNTADAMFQTKRYLYVAFMCQQAIEKLLKAAYVKARSSTPPYTHNLLRLLQSVPWVIEMQSTDLMQVLEELNSYYIESRYSEDIQGLSTILTEKRAEQVLKSTKELYRWIQDKISSETRS
jgi:HEPN domain-containing protein